MYRQYIMANTALIIHCCSGKLGHFGRGQYFSFDAFPPPLKKDMQYQQCLSFYLPSSNVLGRRKKNVCVRWYVFAFAVSHKLEANTVELIIVNYSWLRSFLRYVYSRESYKIINKTKQTKKNHQSITCYNQLNVFLKRTKCSINSYVMWSVHFHFSTH